MNQNPKNLKSPLAGGTPPLRTLLCQAARRAIEGAAVSVEPISLEFDIPEDAAFPQPQQLAELVSALVRGSLDCLPDGGEIMLTFWQASDHCEIEVADNGPAAEARPHRLPMIAAALGAELVWQNCPQGGAAVTARLRRTASIREAA